MELQNLHSKNAIVVKTIESEEKEDHVPGSLGQVLAPMMWFGEIASVDSVCTGEARNAPKGRWVLGGEIEIPYIYYVYGCKKKKKYSDCHQKHCFIILNYIYYLSTCKFNFFPKRTYMHEGLYLRVLITGDIYIFQIWWAYIRLGQKTRKAFFGVLRYLWGYIKDVHNP